MNVSSTFRSMLMALCAFFSAAEKIGKTLDNLATVAEETSGAYVDEARADRQAKIAAREQAAAAIELAQGKASSTTSNRATAKA